MNSTRLASDLSLEDGSRVNSVSKYDKVKRASCVFAVQECAPKHRASADWVLMHEIFLYWWDLFRGMLMEKWRFVGMTTAMLK